MSTTNQLPNTFAGLELLAEAAEATRRLELRRLRQLRELQRQLGHPGEPEYGFESLHQAASPWRVSEYWDTLS
jgi:hypothetical protein